jgi:hypothetical protein
VVGTGSAVSPFILCLSAQGYRQDRSDDHVTLDGLKFSVSRQAWFSDRACFGRSVLRVYRAGWPDAPTGVSDHRGFRIASHLGGYGTLRFRVDTEISIYLGCVNAWANRS